MAQKFVDIRLDKSLREIMDATSEISQLDIEARGNPEYSKFRREFEGIIQQVDRIRRAVYRLEQVLEGN
jgi:hypothetical protein